MVMYAQKLLENGMDLKYIVISSLNRHRPAVACLKWPDKSTINYAMLDFESDIENL